MPAQIPSWLNRPDYIAAMQAGASAGSAQGQDALEAAKLQEDSRQANQRAGLQQQQISAQANQAQARIAQAQANAAMEQQQHAQDMAIKQGMFQQTQLREQVKADVEKARGESLIGLQQSRLDQEGKKLEAAATAVARKYANQQKVQARQAELVASGMPVEQAVMVANLESPDTSASGVAALGNAMRPRQAPAVQRVVVQYQEGNPEGVAPGKYWRGSDNSLQRIGDNPVSGGMTSNQRRLVLDRYYALDQQGREIAREDPERGQKLKLLNQHRLAMEREFPWLLNQAEAAATPATAPVAPEATPQASPATNSAKRLRWTPQGFQPIQ